MRLSTKHASGANAGSYCPGECSCPGDCLHAMENQTIGAMEGTALLRDQRDHFSNPHNCHNVDETSSPGTDSLVPEYGLPVSLLAALAMASTAATTYFAYSTLLCKNPRHCVDGETSRFASAVAFTVCASNTLGLAALGILQRFATNRRLGLVLWMLCRSMNAVMLLIGGEYKSCAP